MGSNSTLSADAVLGWFNSLDNSQQEQLLSFVDAGRAMLRPMSMPPAPAAQIRLVQETSSPFLRYNVSTPDLLRQQPPEDVFASDDTTPPTDLSLGTPQGQSTPPLGEDLNIKSKRIRVRRAFEKTKEALRKVSDELKLIKKPKVDKGKGRTTDLEPSKPFVPLPDEYRLQLPESSFDRVIPVRTSEELRRHFSANGVFTEEQLEAHVSRELAVNRKLTAMEDEIHAGVFPLDFSPL